MKARATYSNETLASLFDAVERDDIVDPVVSLPDPMPMDCTRGEMSRALDLSVQFWRTGAVRAHLGALAMTLLRTGQLSPDDRIRYKHIRACYKHLRFAVVLYGARHKAPLLFRCTVAVMGHLQDAFRNRRMAAVLGYALLLRLLVSWPSWLAVQREVNKVRLDDAAGFLAYRRADFGRLRTWLHDAPLTGHRFHAMRKVISRQVSFYDTLRILKPDDQLYRMSRYLSAINGLMGSLHDDLVREAMAGNRDYHRDTFPLHHDIHERLNALVAAKPSCLRSSD